MIYMSDKLKSLMDELKKTNSEAYYHSLRTKKYTNEIIHLMNENGVAEFSDKEIDYICKGAILHDIGKLNVGNFILTKEDRLNEEERTEIRMHPRLGWDLIRDEIFGEELDFIKNICLYHHERIDGKGYEGLADVPIYVQVVSICDAFDAVHSDRSYHEAKTVEQTIALIESGACGAFDDVVVEHLKQICQNMN